MTKPSSPIALCAAMPVPDQADGLVPEWVHLLPAGEIRTVDGRGPYRVQSLHDLAAQLKDGDRLPIDECHSTDRAAPRGDPAPARGWIVALEAREDGLWGQVEWTGTGRQLMEDKAYRGLSPAILHDAKNTVVGLLRASLINTPNLKGLVALHSEEDKTMDWKAKLIELLKLDSEADDAAVETALQSAIEGGGGKLALQSVIESEPYVALQAQYTDLSGKFDGLVEDRAREKAEGFVDAAIAAGTIGVKAQRDTYIALHMEDPARAETLIGAMPKVKGETHTGDVPATADENGLSDANRQVIALMGLSEEEYLESLSPSGKQKEAL